MMAFSRLQGHYRRGIALSALGKHEEALYAFCISVAIDKNPQAVRHELTKVCFRHVLITYTVKSKRSISRINKPMKKINNYE